MKKLIFIISLLTLLNIDFIQSMEKDNEKYSLIDISDNEKKDEALAMTINDIVSEKILADKLIIALTLIQEGANPNMLSMGESLLYKVVFFNAKTSVIRELLELNADYTYKHYLTGPIFFDAQKEEVAQLFINKGVDLNSVNGNDHNVLWHVMESKFPVELVRFYLDRNVNVSHVDKWDGACVLHSFAAYKEVKDKYNFLAKARLILEKNSKLVYLFDNNNETPSMVAEKTIRVWGAKYPTCISPLTKLIALFKAKI